MKHPPSNQAFGPTISRVSDVMAHIQRYAFRGVSKLANDAGVSMSSLSRLNNHKTNPSFVTVARITTAIEKQLGFHIDPRDLVSENGQFLTRYACDLVRCPGCLPENALDEFGQRTPAYSRIKSGQWVTSRYPAGTPKKGITHE
ncbi:MAG: hypothetical protein JST40_12740 [Armatimonadetes bacterium]|nr:hypothetical protein [Armatimonadota bacterium]